jgi:putative ABC transport system permease protein
VNSRPEFGPVQKLIASGRDITEINGRKVKLVGTFSMGTTFAADGNVVMSDLNFHRIFPSRSPDQIDLGFIMLAPGADIIGVQAELLRLIGQDVRVLTYEQLVRFEQAYWENSAPLGFVFGFGTLMGLIVGMVIVYQILFTDIGSNIPQYATLVAMGYSQSYLRNIVFASSIYLAIFGFLPGVVLSTILYDVAERSIFIPFSMGVDRIASVFFFILTMCALAGLLAIRKLKSADPADMFS